MSNNKQKPTMFSEFLEQLRAENSENFAKSLESFNAMVNKLGLLGAFAMIKTFSENAENTIISSPFVPLSMLKLYMDGIVNICVVIERVITEQEKKLENLETVNPKQEETTEEKRIQIENDKIFNSLLSKIKGEKN